MKLATRFGFFALLASSVAGAPACGDDDDGGETPSNGKGGGSGTGGNSTSGGQDAVSGSAGTGDGVGSGGISGGGAAGDPGLGGTTGVAGEAGGFAGGEIGGEGGGPGGTVITPGGRANGGASGNAGNAGSTAIGGTAGSAGGGTSGTAGGGTTGSAGGGTTGSGGTAGGGTAGGGTTGSGGTTGGSAGGGTTGSGGATGGTAGGGATTFPKVADIAFKATAATMDPATGSFWLAGAFTGTLTLGSTTLTAAAKGSWAIAQYNSSGTLVQAFKTVDVATATSNPGAGTPTAIALDAAGNVYVAAKGLVGNATLPTTTTPKTLTYTATDNTASGQTASDAVVAKFDATGRSLWSFNFPADDLPSAYLAVGGGRVALALPAFLPSFSASHLGSGTTGTGMISAGSTGGGYLLVAAFSADSGAFQWAKTFGSTLGYDQQPSCVALDSLGNVLLAGTYDGEINFNPTVPAALLTLADPAGPDAFVAKLAGADAAHLYSKRLAGTDSSDAAVACTVAPGSNDLFVAGTFDGATINLGGSPITTSGVAAGFLVRLDATGNHVRSAKMPGTVALSADSAGNVLVGASVAPSNPYDFGGGLLSGTTVAWFSPTWSLTASQSLQTTLAAKVWPFVGDARLAAVFPTATGVSFFSRGR